jgi:hypothetical protein
MPACGSATSSVPLGRAGAARLGGEQFGRDRLPVGERLAHLGLRSRGRSGSVAIVRAGCGRLGGTVL